MARRFPTTLVPLLAALLAASSWLSCSRAGGDGTEPDQQRPVFRVATLVWVGYAPIHLAEEKGFFNRHGVEVRLQRIDDTSARRAALSSGSVDASVDIVDSFANGAAQGIPAKVVLQLDDSMGGDGIVVRNGIDSIAELEGKTVAFPPGQPSHFFLLSLLDDADLTTADLDVRPMEADQAGAAFVSKRVDAAVTWEPWLTRAADLPHGRVLVTSREKPGLIVDVFTVRSDYLERHPEVVRSFMKGWFDAVDFWRENPEEANSIMAEALDLEPELFERMIAGVRYSDLARNREFFERDGEGRSEFRELLSRAGEIWRREGVIDHSPDSAAVDGSDLVLNLAG